MSEPTFWLRPEGDDRWTAGAGQQLAGREVRYGRLGVVGTVRRTVPVSAGRSLRIHVALDRKLPGTLDPAKFSLAPASKAKASE